MAELPPAQPVGLPDWAWRLVSPACGGASGIGLALSVPLKADASTPAIPLWLVTPFVVMLAGIALLPILARSFWEKHYPNYALFLGGLVTAYYAVGLGAFGRGAMGHAAVEYFQFIALIGSLYVACGGILIDISGRGRPSENVAILGIGAILANLVGTTGASMLLIRPYLRVNQGRLRPYHVIFFIFIVSNCGGCLTPIGDPPLFLGYLKGVPFAWTLWNLWPMWLYVNGTLLLIFLLVEAHFYNTSDATTEKLSVRISGRSGLLFLVLIVGSVLLDGVLKDSLQEPHVPFGGILQVALAAAAFKCASRENLKRNEFSMHPIQEVAYLFAGIFATMVPALACLEQNSAGLGIESPSAFYFCTGTLSAILDNAPTYLSFLQASFGQFGMELVPAQVPDFLQASFAGHSGAAYLAAISQGAVFFGAMTYIGNGPNFMVKAIAEVSGVRMPGFLGYVLYAIGILLPVLIANWLFFVR